MLFLQFISVLDLIENEKSNNGKKKKTVKEKVPVLPAIGAELLTLNGIIFYEQFLNGVFVIIYIFFIIHIVEANFFLFIIISYLR